MNGEVVLLSIGLVIGVIVTLFFIGKRPVHVNLNVDARAEANGGSAYAGASDGDGGGGAVGGFFSGVAKLLKIAVVGAVVVFGALLLLQKNEPAKVVVNVPEQKPAPVVVNVPTQQAPVVNVPQQPAPIINVPKQEPAVVNVPVSTSSPLETVMLLIGGLASILTIIISFKVLRGLREPNQPSQPVVPTEYERTSYGWTPKRQSSGGPISGSEAYPDLFKQTVKK